MKKQILAAAVLATFGAIAATGAQAAVLNTGDQLTLNAATFTSGYVSGGSFFGMDLNGNAKLTESELTGMKMCTNGVIIGSTTTPGSYHAGPQTTSDTGTVDGSWFFNNSTGSNWFSGVAPTGSTTAGLNFGGWNVSWSALSAIPMTTGAWQLQVGPYAPANCTALGCTGHTFTNGNAQLVWNGTYGSTYQLNYSATVPIGDPSGFGGTQYFLHLEGVVNAVPVPAAVWLFGSGLLGLVGIARRKKKA